MKKIISGLVIASFAAALLTACNGQGSTGQSTPSVTPVLPDPPAEIREQAVPQHAAPFTGMPLHEKAEQRPAMVMLNNHPSARPQSGISYADVLYESLAEGEITRIAAVYQSTDYGGPIGPVRSIRPYYIDLSKIYDALIIHAGGSPDAYQRLARQKPPYLDEITNAGGSFWRESFRKAPHNLYTDLTRIRTGADKLGHREDYAAPQAVPAFLHDELDKPGDPSSGVTVTFLLDSYKVAYKYDAQRKVYDRFVNDEPHEDLSNHEQLAATNVVILAARHIVLDNEGRRDIRLIGSGQGIVLQRGKHDTVSWKRKDASDRFHLTRDGVEVGLYPGKTHYLIVPDAPSLDAHVEVAREATAAP
ncbi:DUF3048 domain-containing protein [Paenibacillus xerothermodurans]|nr:DUF3048 domain-containing protein [Paenibacillus xerothermodurans]